MKYVILNDGETYTTFENCIIYDAETNKLYQIQEGVEILDDVESAYWHKGIFEIHENEDEDDSDREEDDFYDGNIDCDEDNVLGM